MSADDRAVLFDVDGTLVDTPGGMLGVLRAVLEESGHAVADDLVRRTIGRPLAASFAGLLFLPEDHPDVAHAVTRARALFTETVIPSAADLVFPGIPELLAELRAQGRPLAVVTSKVRPSAVELLGAAGLLDAFDTLSCHGMADRGKPHADLALLAAGALGVPPRRCVVVGDAVDDVRMASAAGMDACGVDFGVATRAELVAAGASRVVGSVAELHDAVAPRRLHTSDR
ncbi:HAD family hydrolase [Umezawaea tangerina]|uniref:Phosphoglycolate phosphatase n=1 Tax=Umezawaea tangerina TaxID=84725 RepID=A0A2T0SQW7_9PSEU|nr:HAD family hydrolase [Umezawaea tangerina]PRY35763.1 phosphoglycolate phosphatase [Umezawaea tangerina]